MRAPKPISPDGSDERRTAQRVYTERESTKRYIKKPDVPAELKEMALHGQTLDASPVRDAFLLTGAAFTGLSGYTLVSRRDFSFLGAALSTAAALRLSRVAAAPAGVWAAYRCALAAGVWAAAARADRASGHNPGP